MTMSLAKIVVPSFLAGVGLAVAIGAVHGGVPFASEGSVAAAAEPTPYSADHGRVSRAPGTAEEPAPTF
jgi:hypothetical protein